MKTRVLLAFSFIGMTGALLVTAQSVLAQAPAGPVASPPPGGAARAAKAPEPVPLAPPRQTILGAWTLNRDESDEERQKMQELLRPPAAMTLSITGAEVDLKDDHDRKRAFMTDGRKLQKSKDNNYQEIAAKWDGNRLVTDEKNPRGGKMSRTFELSADGRQLYETLNLKLGRSNTETAIRYVYDIPAQTQQ